MVQLSRNELLAELRPRAAELEAFYRRARMVAVSTKTDFPQFEGAEVMRYVYRSNADRIRFDQTFIARKRSKTWDEFAMVATPDSAFRVARFRGDSEYSLRSYSGDPGNTDLKIRWKYPFVAGPYQVMDVRVVDLFDQPDLEWLSCERFRREDESCVRVDCRSPGTQPHSIVFSEDRAWAIVEHVWGSSDRRDHRRIEYDLDHQLPTVSRYEQWSQFADGRTSHREVVEIEEFVAVPAEPELFELAAFGIDSTPTKDVNL